MTLNQLLEIRSLITVAHHIPGRIRLKFSKGIITHPIVQNFIALGKDQSVKDKVKEKGFISAKINFFALSLTIEYDPARIAPQVLDIFFSGKDIDEVKELAQEVAALLNIDLQLE